MPFKKYIIFLIVLLCLILSISYLFNVISFDNIPLGMAVSTQIKNEKDVVVAAKNTVMNKKQTLLDFSKNNTCYWIRTTRNRTHYILEINEYEYLSNMKGCFGTPKSVKYMAFDYPILLRGIDCVCDNNNYLFEWKDDGLKISKPIKTQLRIRLGLTEFLEGLSNIFIKKG